MLEIALVRTGNLKGNVNAAFTIGRCGSSRIFAKRTDDGKLADHPTMLQVFTVEQPQTGPDCGGDDQRIMERQPVISRSSGKYSP